MRQCAPVPPQENLHLWQTCVEPTQCVPIDIVLAIAIIKENP